MRYAYVPNGTVEQVSAYLPGNYTAEAVVPEGGVLVSGEDVAGWTLDGYVLPRLASGCYFGTEVRAA